MEPQISLEYVQSQYLLEVTDVIRSGPRLFQIVGPADVYGGHLDTPPQARLRMYMTDYVSQQGFRHTPRLLLSRHHERVLMLGDNVAFYLVGPLQGEAISVPIQDDVIYAIGQRLARLHESLTGVTENMPEEAKRLISARYGGWQRHFQQGYELLVDAGARAEAHFALTSLKMLKACQYTSVCEKAKQCQEMAWNGIELDAFRVNRDLSIVSIQYRRKPLFVEEIYDVCTLAADLSTIAPLRTIDRLLEGYTSERELSEASRRTVYACALFPHLGAYRVRQGSYEKQPSGNQPSKSNELDEELVQYRKTATEILKRHSGV